MICQGSSWLRSGFAIIAGMYWAIRAGHAAISLAGFLYGMAVLLIIHGTQLLWRIFTFWLEWEKQK
jgi:hypothetical protein